MFLTVRYIPGKKNILADQLIHLDQVLQLSGCFFLGCLTLSARSMGILSLIFFATRTNLKLPLYMASIPDSMVWKD